MKGIKGVERVELIKEWTTPLRYKPYDEWSKTYIELLESQIRKSKWKLAFHIQPKTGLLNDPNGFSYYDGKWHLFYQAYPFGPVHGVKSRSEERRVGRECGCRSSRK